VERLQKLQQELEGKASDTTLARWEMDLTFREEMLTRRGKMLAEHELEAEEKEKKLEEWILQFQAAQAAPGP
jgi:hypothetical protein